MNRGEINQTIYRRFIHREKRGMKRLLKGVEIGRYRENSKLKQGIREWFDESSFIDAGFEKPIACQRRIATQRITGVDERLRLVATLIEPPAYFADSTNSISISATGEHRLEFLLGCLNSKLFQWRFKLTSTNNNVGTNELLAMPFRIIDFSQRSDKARHERMLELVSRILNLHREIPAAKTAQQKTVLQRQITTIDNQIDRLVYELYGLTGDEIAIVEEATHR